MYYESIHQFFALYQARCALHLTRPKLRLHPGIIGEIYNVGVPTILMNSLGSVLVTGLNGLLMQFSETAVSVFGIYYRLQTFAFMPVSGLTQGALPIMAYNYGSRARSRVLRCLRDGLFVSFGILIACCLLFVLLPTPLLWLFGADAGMLSIGVPALRLLALSYLPAALGFCIPTLFQAVGRGRSSLMIFLLRQFLITLPLAWLLAGPLGLPGIWLSFLAAETVAALAAVGMLLRLLHTDPILRAEKSE